MTKKIAILLTCVLIVALAVVTVYAVTATYADVPGQPTAQNTGENSEDLTKYITVVDNDIGGKTYAWAAGRAPEDIAPGTIFTYGDYMYVYGYYYNRAAAPVTTALTGWTAQGADAADFGWGCTAISKTNSVYGDPFGYIQDEPVTRFDNCYRGCTLMTELPLIPHTATVTTNLCNDCTALLTAEVDGLAVLGDNAFTGCTALRKVYLGTALTSIPATSAATSPFYNVGANCKVYAEAASKPAGWGSYYNKRTSSTNVTVRFSSTYEYYYNPTYTITFKWSDGTTITGLYPNEYYEGLGAPLPTVPQDGTGWYTSSACTGTPVTAITTSDTGDKVFYVKKSS